MMTTNNNSRFNHNYVQAKKTNYINLVQQQQQ